MTRELRLKTSGIIFYIIFILNLSLTNTGLDFLKELASQKCQFDVYETVAALVGLGAVFFTSEAIGYLFSTLYSFWWNIILGKFRWGKGGYSREWQKLGHTIKSITINNYKLEADVSQKNEHKKIEAQWESYSYDVFLSYFWQQAPERIIDWTVRRLNLFFTGMSTLTGIFLSMIVSNFAIWKWNMGWTSAHFYIVIISLVLGIMIYWTSCYCRYEAWQMIDLWFAGKLNPKMQNVMKKYSGPG